MSTLPVVEWLRQAESRLKEAGIQAAKMEAQLLAAHVLRVDRAWLMAHPEWEFNDLAGETLLQRREGGEPLAYILGWREFYGRSFGVDPSVLIPRHETETLVEAALSLGPRPTQANGAPGHAQHVSSDGWSVLDLGTGSGIVAITLKLERPDWEVTGVDISAEALTTASANARFLQANVRFLLSDGFVGLLGEGFDMIVSNPPYIGQTEKLSAEVVEHEPHQALFSGPTGLEFYERLAKEASGHLRDGGLLLLELGHTQRSAVEEIFTTEGWRVQETRQDLSGVERVLVARFEY